VEREWLDQRLQEGLSLERIGELAGKNPSTVGYWVEKHGLRASGAAKFSARGAPERQLLEGLAQQGATLRAMALATDRSMGTVRHWLRRWEIERGPRAGRRPNDPTTAEPVVEMTCVRHGLTSFRLEGRGYYRCRRCRQERVVEWRRRVKRKLVEEAGGRCRLCGYDSCVAALQFHHLEPSNKAFELSRRGATRSLSEARAEAQKCVLLCANCHAEVESGFSSVQRSDAA